MVLDYLILSINLLKHLRWLELSFDTSEFCLSHQLKVETKEIEGMAEYQLFAIYHLPSIVFTFPAILYWNKRRLPPMSDQERISPYNINTISSKEVMKNKVKHNSEDY